ncbi:MAG: hypothetical protein FGF53_07070, partial [Candidatus Brockarchaeota archaeon]|nr:hypothetical protein [Candidatus Brockarchaeota archaeon]
MIRRITGILLILILLTTAENASIMVKPGEAGEQPASVELDALIREIELGIPPEGPLSDREFLMPEGVSVDDVKNLWRCAAPFVSYGADDNDIRNAFTSLNETVRLPDAVRIGNESFQIRYDKAYVERNSFGQVLIHIPIDVPLFRTLPACFHVYSRAIGGKQHLIYNVTETRWYRVRRRIEGLYNITYLDLETGEIHSVLTSLSLGVYPEFGIAGNEPAQPSFPSYLLKYFSGYANLTSIPPGTIIDFERSTPSFLVAVPGHYEDIDVLVPEHMESFRVLFPAYDPVWLTGWLVETSLSSSSVETGDILEISYVATPVNIDPGEQPLNATLTLLCPGGFQPLDSVQRRLDNTQTFGSFKLKAVSPGTYILTLKLDGNAFFPGWPPTDEVSYTVNVVGPESPMVEVSLEGGAPFFKHVNLTVRLKNKGAGEAFNTILEFSGEVEPLSLSVGSIAAGETWSRMVTLRLKSEVANIRARVTFFDASGNKYVSEGSLTVMSPNYVVPEHFEEYTLRVPEHFEKRRVFVPGYEGYTHVKIYHPYSAFEIPGSFTISFQDLILEAEGVKVYTSFLPIADEGFELRVIPKEVTLNIYGNVLVGPLIPVQGLQTTVPVKYVVKSVEPAFEEKMLRENEARSILNVTGCGELVAPEGCEVILASKRVVRKQVWVDSATYRKLQQEGFGRMRGGCYWYEDGGREEWPSADAICELTPLERELYANRIILVYHPLQETPLESSLVRGIWLRNYATQDIDYAVTVEPVTLPPGKPETATMKAEKACCRELSILLFTNITFWIRLHKDDRLVAELFMPRVLSLPFPFSLQWWRGFILGFVERSPRIMVNTMMLSMVAMVPRELMPVIAVALVFMKAYQVYSQRGEVFNATMALGNLTAMGLIYRGMADGYRLQNKTGFAAICDNLSQTFLSKAKEVASDLGLRLVMDVSLDDLKTALGWRKASEYEQGYAAGRIVGAMVEAVAYAATFATVCHEFSTARDTLTSAGEAGRISTSSVLKRFAQGLYAWVTPAIWDLAETGLKLGAWLKGKLTIPDVLKLVFADQVSKGFGETVGEALQRLPDGGEPEDIAKRFSDIVDKITSDKDIPESIAKRMLDILGRMGEEYVGREQAAETIVEAWKRISKLEAWKKGDEAGELLMDWLESMEVKRVGETLDVLQRITTLGAEELEGLGKVLAKVGYENGVKLFGTYFKTAEQYNKDIAGALVKAVLEDLSILDSWTNGKVVVTWTHGADMIKVPEGVDPGAYRIAVISKDGAIKSDFINLIGKDQETITVKGIGTGEFIFIFKPTSPPEVVKWMDSRNVFKWYEDLWGRKPYVIHRENVYLVDKNGRVWKEFGPGVFSKSRSGGLSIDFGTEKKIRLYVDDGKLAVFYYTASGSYERVFISGFYALPVVGSNGEELGTLFYAAEESGNYRCSLGYIGIALTENIYVFDLTKSDFLEYEGQTRFSIEEKLRMIFGDSLLSEMENGKATVALVYESGGGIQSQWRQSKELKFELSGKPELLRLCIVRITEADVLSGKSWANELAELVPVKTESGTSFHLKYTVITPEDATKTYMIPVVNPTIDVTTRGTFVKMLTPNGDMLVFRLKADESGVHPILQIHRGGSYHDMWFECEATDKGFVGTYKYIEEDGNEVEFTLDSAIKIGYDAGERISSTYFDTSGRIPREVLSAMVRDEEAVKHFLGVLKSAEDITMGRLAGERHRLIRIEGEIDVYGRKRFPDLQLQRIEDSKLVLVEYKHGDETYSQYLDKSQIIDYVIYAHEKNGMVTTT